jgi:hypothetical protein
LARPQLSRLGLSLTAHGALLDALPLTITAPTGGAEVAIGLTGLTLGLKAEGEACALIIATRLKGAGVAVITARALVEVITGAQERLDVAHAPSTGVVLGAGVLIITRRAISERLACACACDGVTRAPSTQLTTAHLALKHTAP